MQRIDPKAKQDVVIHLRVSTQLYDRMKKIADDEDRTILAIARRSITAGVEVMSAPLKGRGRR